MRTETTPKVYAKPRPYLVWHESAGDRVFPLDSEGAQRLIDDYEVVAVKPHAVTLRNPSGEAIEIGVATLGDLPAFEVSGGEVR